MTRTRAIAYFLDSLNQERGGHALRRDRGERGESPKPLPVAESPGERRN